MNSCNKYKTIKSKSNLRGAVSTGNTVSKLIFWIFNGGRTKKFCLHYLWLPSQIQTLNSIIIVDYHYISNKQINARQRQLFIDLFPKHTQQQSLKQSPQRRTLTATTFAKQTLHLRNLQRQHHETSSQPRGDLEPHLSITWTRVSALPRTQRCLRNVIRLIAKEIFTFNQINSKTAL